MPIKPGLQVDIASTHDTAPSLMPTREDLASIAPELAHLEAMDTDPAPLRGRGRILQGCFGERYTALMVRSYSRLRAHRRATFDFGFHRCLGVKSAVAALDFAWPSAARTDLARRRVSL
jgi:hypothetical protein